MNSIASLVEKKVEGSPKLTLWHVSDFLNLGRASNIKVIFARLAEEGKLVRAMDGIYYCPKKVMGIDVPPSMHDIARKLAKLHCWSIVPSGEAALNKLGLSTQMPSRYEYLSDGPYRDYVIDGVCLSFRHRSARFIKGMSYKTALFIEAVNELGKSNIDDATIEGLANAISQKEISQILEEAKYAPKWVYEIALRVEETKDGEHRQTRATGTQRPYRGGRKKT